MALNNFFQGETVAFSVRVLSGGVPLNIENDEVTLKLKRSETSTVDLEVTADTTSSGASGYALFNLSQADTNLVPGIYYYEIILERQDGKIYYLETGFVEIYEAMPAGSGSFVTTGVDYLIPELRVHLGDVDSSSYKYDNSFLRSTLIVAVKALMRKWNSRYKIDDSGVVSRNSSLVYADAEPPTIMYSDEYPIILQASIIVKSSVIQNNAWDVASWRDDEISYSNISGAKLASESLEADRAELERILRKKLYGASKQSLLGFKYPPNYFEG